MNTVATVSQKQLKGFLLNVAIARPVFIWGAPGIGKSAIVQEFAHEVGLECVSMLGSQLAPEDLIGVPQIEGGVSRFCPPRMIAREEPYCLFLDELNACTHEVQKAFYSLIHERRIGEYHLPGGSIVVGAGNRAQDSAIVKPMSSALLNRMIHVHLGVSNHDWLEWAYEAGIHSLVMQYIEMRPDHLWAQPPKHEEPFSSPRAWHMLSDAMKEYGDALDENMVEVLAYGCLTPAHATQFKAFYKQVHGDYRLTAILKGDQRWPDKPGDRDILYFLSQALRAHLIKELPRDHKKISRSQNDLLFRAKALIGQLASINLEIAQMVVSDEEGQEQGLPDWFLVEVVRDLPRLVHMKENAMARRHHNNPTYSKAQAEARAKTLKQRDEFFWDAYWAVSRHPLFGPMDYYIHVARPDELRHRGWAIVSDEGRIYYNPAIEGTREEWAYVIAHCFLHLGLGHFQGRRYPAAWNVACDLVVGRFLAQFKLGEHPLGLPGPDIGSGQTEDTLYERFCREGVPDRYMAYGVGEEARPDMIWEEKPWRTRDNKPIEWPRLFAAGMREAVASAVDVAGGERRTIYDGPTRSRTQAQAARDWCINRFPLLGALAAAFTVIEDPVVCRRIQVSVAAVDPAAKEIYFNPAAGLNEDEYRFVMAHELLHVGLRHHIRQEGRDHYLWNIACDYVINAWLIEMGVGVMPRFGAMYDPKLKNLSAESIYDQIAGDLHALQRACTLRGKGTGDILGAGDGEWWRSRDGTTLDDFYRRCLGQGLMYHEQSGRGYLPAGLVEEIRAMSQPPIPWDVELAAWFEAHFAPLEKIRSYAQPSRRQSSTPDIPRPRWVDKPDAEDGRTFGVVLDTSGSMDRQLLAKALGAIASYSLAHEVPAARVVFCDAAAYDQGYMAPEDIAGRVKVRGRGGTILQPAIDLLEKAPDFPKDGPILIITDTYCDHVHLHREHAYLIPEGSKLPFPPRGEVFKIRA